MSRPSRTYSASAGTVRPFLIRTISTGFPRHDWVSAEAIRLSSTPYSTDVPPARRFHGSRPMHTATFSSSPAFIDSLYMWRRCRGTMRHAPRFLSRTRIRWNERFRAPFHSATQTPAVTYRPASRGKSFGIGSERRSTSVVLWARNGALSTTRASVGRTWASMSFGRSCSFGIAREAATRSRVDHRLPTASPPSSFVKWTG